jgi:hypothetical protein
MALRGIQVPSFRLQEAPLAPRFARKRGRGERGELEDSDVGYGDISPLISEIPSLQAGHVNLTSPAGDTPGSITGDFAPNPPSPHDLASHPPSSRSLRKKQRHNEYRRRKRAFQQAEEGSADKRVAKKRRRESHLLQTGIDAINLPVTSSGWQGIPAKVKLGTALYTKAQLVDELGFTHVDWDGV